MVLYLNKEFLLQDNYIALAYVAKMHISCILFIFVTKNARHTMRVFFFLSDDGHFWNALLNDTQF